VTETLEEHLLMRSWILPATARAAGMTERLRSRHQVELQVVPDSRWGALIRVSVAWYTEPDEVARLLAAVRAEL
jgi:selenocysteine lyase/cysteine desulfurase